MWSTLAVLCYESPLFIPENSSWEEVGFLARKKDKSRQNLLPGLFLFEEGTLHFVGRMDQKEVG